MSNPLTDEYFIKRLAWPWPKHYTIALIDFPSTKTRVIYVLKGMLSTLWFLEGEITPDLIEHTLSDDKWHDAIALCKQVIPVDRPHSHLHYSE